MFLAKLWREEGLEKEGKTSGDGRETMMKIDIWSRRGRCRTSTSTSTSTSERPLPESRFRVAFKHRSSAADEARAKPRRSHTSEIRQWVAER